MRPIRLGLFAALIVALLAPATAMAAAAPAKPAVPVVKDAERKVGMADTPALVAAANLHCQVSDARLAGKSSPDKKTGSLGASVYEVACGPGAVGYLLQTNGTAAPTVYSCLIANYPPDMKPPSSPCILPANIDLRPAIAALAAKAKVPCVPQGIRGVGQTASNTVIELSCPGGAGYLLMASAPLDMNKDATALNCLAYDAANANIKCALSEPAARLALADKFATMASPGCAVKDRRYIGLLTDGTEGYEFACADGKGFIAKVDAKGAIAANLDCTKLNGGGCTLTDTRAATAEQAGLYSRLAKSSGSDCVVSKYAVFPAKGTNEVVELVCGDGKGAIGMFPPTGKGKVLDCGHALVAGYRCSLGAADYSGLTADLKKFNLIACNVSSVGQPLKAADGSIRLEVACADGLPGYMIQYTDPQTAKEAVGCRFAGGCVLPTNKTTAPAKG